MVLVNMMVDMNVLDYFDCENNRTAELDGVINVVKSNGIKDAAK